MIALVIVVLAVLVVAAIVWTRVASARSAAKSVETYERALGALGEVSKRTESAGFRILPHEETGRPHVGRPIDEAGEETPTAHRDARTPGQGPLSSSRLAPAGEPKLRFSGPNRMPGSMPEAHQQTGDQEGDGQQAGLPATGGTVAGARVRSTVARAKVPGMAEARARGQAYKSTAERHRQVMVRRAAAGAALAVAVVAVVVATISLSSGGGHRVTLPTTTVRSGSGGHTTTSTTTTLPTSLKPTPVSPSVIAFTVPSGSYTLAFQAAGGACWVGVEHTTAGPWLFAETLRAGQTATYKGSGALVMTLGAPAYIGFTVNGLVAELPSGITQPYNVELTPASG